MSLHPCITEILDRDRRFAAEKGLSGKGQLSPESWAYIYKDEGVPILGMGRTGAAEPDQANEEEMYIPFTISVLREDRDGDIVVPKGCYLGNYERNPLVFFGHQQWEVPIGKAKSPDGRLCVWPEESRIRAGVYFDKEDPDAVYIYGKVKRGFLNATSIAFVPIEAYRRDREFEKGLFDDGKAHPYDQGGEGPPAGWIFKRYDLTEFSIVGVPSNAGAIRDGLDQDRKHITPRLYKAMGAYAAKSKKEQGVCYTGWCPAPSYGRRKSTGKGVDDLRSDLAKAAEFLKNHEDPAPMPGYGQLYAKPMGSGVEVWYVGGDGDEDGFSDLVEDTLFEINGVNKVTCVSEGFPPRDDKEWVKVYPTEKALRKILSGSACTCDYAKGHRFRNGSGHSPDCPVHKNWLKAGGFSCKCPFEKKVSGQPFEHEDKCPMKANKDLLPGGAGDRLKPQDVDPEELRLGVDEEMEHTNDPKMAQEIALDHLAEDPHYYTNQQKGRRRKKGKGGMGLDDLRGELNRAAQFLNTHEDPSSKHGYGQLFAKPSPGGGVDVWYVGEDGDDSGFGDLVEETIREIDGVNTVKYEREAFPPRGDKEWVLVNSTKKAKVVRAPGARTKRAAFAISNDAGKWWNGTGWTAGDWNAKVFYSRSAAQAELRKIAEREFTVEEVDDEDMQKGLKSSLGKGGMGNKDCGCKDCKAGHSCPCDKSLGESSGTAGGYLVPKQTVDEDEGGDPVAEKKRAAAKRGTKSAPRRVLKGDVSSVGQQIKQVAEDVISKMRAIDQDMQKNRILPGGKTREQYNAGLRKMGDLAKEGVSKIEQLIASAGVKNAAEAKALAQAAGVSVGSVSGKEGILKAIRDWNERRFGSFMRSMLSARSEVRKTRKSVDEEEKDLTNEGNPVEVGKKKRVKDEDEAEEKSMEDDEEVKDFSVEDGGVPEESDAEMEAPYVPKHSAGVMGSLYSHAKSESDYLDEELGKMDNPAAAEALSKYKDEHVLPRMEMLTGMLGEHHPDADMEKVLKGMETDGSDNFETGEDNLIDNGEIPPEDAAGDDYSEGVEEDDLDEDDVMEGEADEGDAFAGDETPEEELLEEEQVEDDEDDEESADSLPEAPATDEILERYQEPKSKKWVTRSVGSLRRSKSGRLFLVRKDLTNMGNPVEDGQAEEKDEGGTGFTPTHTATVTRAANHMAALSKAPDLPEHHKAGLEHHSGELLAMCKQAEADMLKPSPEEKENPFAEDDTDNVTKNGTVTGDEEKKSVKIPKQLEDRLNGLINKFAMHGLDVN